MANDEGLRRFGPQTAAGVEKCRQARWKHGRRSAAAIAQRKARKRVVMELLQQLRAVEAELRKQFGTEILDG